MPWKRSGRTEIVHIVVTGYQKRKFPSKHYVFEIDVTWNNNDRFEVYRRYSDFFSFQTTLKALFPAAAGRKHEERVIPQLPKRIFVGRSHIARVAEARLEQINRYTQTLISLDPNISESAHVVGFFTPRSGDKELPKLHLHRPTSLHPSKMPSSDGLEEYCALAEYVADDSSQVSFKPGDKVLVMSKDPSGWWICNVDGEMGWGPPSYLKKCCEFVEDEESDRSEDDEAAELRAKDSDDSGVGENMTSSSNFLTSSSSTMSSPLTSNTPSGSCTTTSSKRSFSSLPLSQRSSFRTPEIVAEEYKAIDAYKADGPGQVSFKVGDTIHVLDKLEDGWWFVSNGKDEGWAPCSYLEGEKDEEGITNLDSAEKYYTVDNYEAEEDDEISFKRGTVVEVLQKSLDGWWMVKINKLVGLAPATFLKKEVENPELLAPKIEEVQKLTSPIAPEDPVGYITFQQPPRKASVRARASMRGSPAAAHKQRTKPTTPSLTSNTSPQLTSKNQENNPFKDIVFPSQPQTKPIPIVISKSVTVESSDSDPDDLYLNVPSFSQLPRSTCQKSASFSNSSSSSSGPRRPVAIPRKNLSQTSSFKSPSPKEESFKPPLPPKPSDLPPIPQRAKIPLKKYKSVDSSLNPQKPLSRPRNSEIRRAQDKARKRPQTTKVAAPALTVLDENGLETASISSRKSSDSVASKISSKSAPSGTNSGKPNGGGGGEKIKKKRAQSTQSDSNTKVASRAKLQVPPPRPPRPRHKSEGEADLTPPPIPAKGSASLYDKSDSAEGLNQDVANTLLKYIIKSEDETLKNALRDLIKEDTDLVHSLNDL